MYSRIPKWLWATVARGQIAVAIPFWRYWQPAPYFEAHGDLYRGWPFVYGLDQGDVSGDEWLFSIAYFQPGAFALDTGLAVVCGLPVSIAILLLWRRHLNNQLPSVVESSA